MHPRILGAGALLAGALGAVQAAGAPPSGRCPAPTAPVIERFTAADCPDCWARAEPAPPGTWTFDWIKPAGDDAALSAAASADSADRADRARRPSAAMPSRARPTVPWLRVAGGPAWSGYLGVRLQWRGRVGEGLQAWLALVEDLPPGSEGNASARALVRNVSGPLPLATPGGAREATHLAAMRWPEGTQPERLRARAWIEDAQGRIVAVVQDRC